MQSARARGVPQTAALHIGAKPLAATGIDREPERTDCIRESTRWGPARLATGSPHRIASAKRAQSPSAAKRCGAQAKRLW